MEKIKLWDNGTPFYEESYGQEETFVVPFIVPAKYDENNQPIKTGCVIVCPGGAYCGLAEYEGDPISVFLNDNGISAFTLNYRCKPYDLNAIKADINRAVRWVRYHAEEYNIDPDKIGVLGFSAGGHLACMGATHYDYGQSGDEIDRVSCRPNAAVLCYPVISMKRELTHEDTRYVLIGRFEEKTKEQLVMQYSGEESITNDTPPMFIWHTAEDDCVNVKNSIMLAKALSEKNIPFELHIFPEGGHGLNLARDFNGGAKHWPMLCADWLHRLGF